MTADRTRPFEHLRHKPPTPLEVPRELVLCCAPMRSNVNLSNMVRTAGCCGVTRVIACGSPKIDRTIARDGADQVQIEVHRTLPPVLKALKAEGYTLVGLEQATNSVSLHEYQFPRRTALVMGNERLGLTEEELTLVDVVVEIPVWGMPHAYNVATSAAMAMYEYCKQWPR
ncbi:MAG: RNA methyltransferase [Pirellulaceae bacterium]|jgi:tRNA G18 (ribose-2'-O)-methylase SpoU|nr:RNA methyltransferase [Pirellulaceae bacterium]